MGFQQLSLPPTIGGGIAHLYAKEIKSIIFVICQQSSLSVIKSIRNIQSVNEANWYVYGFWPHVGDGIGYTPAPHKCQFKHN